MKIDVPTEPCLENTETNGSINCFTIYLFV